MVYVCNFSSPRLAEIGMYVISRGYPPPWLNQPTRLPAGRQVKNVGKALQGHFIGNSSVNP